MLTSKFFVRDTRQVAKNLLGTFLVRQFPDGEIVRRKITETEGYLGEKDKASHARFGETPRTKVMYRRPSVMYVYLIYGMHDMLNIVTEGEGKPEAVLIRGAEDTNGPGKLTKFFNITKDKHNNKMLGKRSGVWINSRDENFDPEKIETRPRVGIDYASKKWRNRKPRFVLSD